MDFDSLNLTKTIHFFTFIYPNYWSILLFSYHFSCTHVLYIFKLLYSVAQLGPTPVLFPLIMNVKTTF